MGATSAMARQPPPWAAMDNKRQDRRIRIAALFAGAIALGAILVVVFVVLGVRIG